MRLRGWGARVAVVVALAAPAAAVDGERLYLLRCAPCHGATGAGDGPDASIFTPRPRRLDAEFLARWDTTQLVRLIRDGAALPLALDPGGTTARLRETELLVAHLRRLPGVDWDVFSDGERVYFRRCQECHGALGEPAGLPPGKRASRSLAAADLGAKEPADALRLVRHDAPGLPALPAPLPDAEAARLLGFVRALTPGFALYARFCASCHGLDGTADEAVDPGHAPRVQFDRDWVQASDPERLRVSVWHMLADQRPTMPHFRTRLSESEARAIAEWLRARPTARP